MKKVLKNKNLAIIIPSLKIGGGAEKVAAQLSKSLEESSYKVYILTFYSHPEEYPHTNNRESLKESLNEFKIFKLFNRTYNIKKFCKKNNIEVAISFMPEANFPLILSKSLGNNVKIIVSERNNPQEKSLLYKMGIKTLYPFANHIVPVTKKIELLLRTNFNLKKVTTIYNPIDIEKSLHLQQEEIPQKYKFIFNDKNFVFINIGRLIKQKNHNSLIRSFQKLTNYNPNAKLVIIGEGPLRNSLEDLVKSLNLQKSIFFIGNQKNVFSFLKASNCFVFSSLWEGFPNVIMEALSTNIPVIARDCNTGPREILAPELDINNKIQYPYIGKYGILINPKDNDVAINELSNSMNKIITNSSLQKKYINNTERLRSLNTTSIVKQWKKIL